MVSLLSISPGSVALQRGGGYASKVLGTQSASLIAYWPMDESSGTTADNAEGTADRDGTYTGVTLADAAGGTFPTAPYWDGANDYLNVYSASLGGAINGAEFAAALWTKKVTAGWAGAGDAFILATDDPDSYRLVQAGAALLQFQYRTTVNKDINITLDDADWHHIALTISESADEIKAYKDGSQVGPTVTGLGTFAGTLNKAIIGAFTTVPAFPWDGWLRHAAIWTTPLTADEISNLATP